MDLRSIINSDSSTAAPPAHLPPSLSHPPPQQQSQRPPSGDYARGSQGPFIPPSSASSYQGGFQGKPAQPPPLQPPSQPDFRSPSTASYYSAQSPYQQTPSSSLSGSQYPFPQHPPPPQSPVAQVQYPQPYTQRESYVTTPVSGQSQHHYYTQPSPSSYTSSATPPGATHPHPPQHHRSQSSYSASTPTSAQPLTPFTHRESPVSVNTQSYSQQQSQQHHHSQPGTPLGPPLSHTRTSSGSQREQHSPYSHKRNQSGGSYGAPPHNQPGSPTPTPTQAMTRPLGTPTGHSSAQSPLQSDHERGGRDFAAARERERSVSISPKTMLPTQTPRQDDQDSKYANQTHLSSQVTPAKRKMEDAAYERNIRSNVPAGQSASPKTMNLDRSDHGLQMAATDGSVNGRNGHHVLDNHAVNSGNGMPGWRDSGMAQAQEQSRPATIVPSPTSQPPTMKDSSRPDVRSHHTPSGNQPNTLHSQQNQQTSSQIPPSRQAQNHQPPKGVPSQPPAPLAPPPLPTVSTNYPPVRDLHNTPATPGSASSPKQPSKKRARYEEPPIFARKASRSTSSSPIMANRRQPGAPPPPTSAALVKQEPEDSKPPSQHPPQPLLDQASVKKEPPNGHPNLISNHSGYVSPFIDNGPLGPWEPTITNVFPYEEVTRLIAIFLDEQVVKRNDVMPVHGQLEIEAKIGQIIDMNKGQRLRLPVLNECILNKDDPNMMRTRFDSSMSEAQHKALNHFLNGAVSKSMEPKRIKMTYVHTKERDSFYEVPPYALNSLPPSIRAQINPRHQAKLRVTTDQKTGKVIAKIIKVRIADLDIYSPHTVFDWRISVNLEMNYDGDIDGLTEGGGNSGKRADRIKDRVTYKHLAYQVDLTQVISDAGQKQEKDHELEVEVLASEVRKHGLRATESTAYEDLIKGFVDNVRVLLRFLK